MTVHSRLHLISAAASWYDELPGTALWTGDESLMSSGDRKVRAYVYRHFVGTGAAPSVARIARELELGRGAVRDALDRLEASRALVLNERGEIWMAHPFSATATRYPVWTRERRYWANCAWDALSIPSLLDRDAVIETTCADCSEPLRLRSVAGELEATKAVVHFLVPARRFWDDIGYT